MALAERPEDRFQTAEEMYCALQSISGAERSQGREVTSKCRPLVIQTNKDENNSIEAAKERDASETNERKVQQLKHSSNQLTNFTITNSIN